MNTNKFVQLSLHNGFQVRTIYNHSFLHMKRNLHMNCMKGIEMFRSCLRIERNSQKKSYLAKNVPEHNLDDAHHLHPGYERQSPPESTLYVSLESSIAFGKWNKTNHCSLDKGSNLGEACTLLMFHKKCNFHWLCIRFHGDHNMCCMFQQLCYCENSFVILSDTR